MAFKAIMFDLDGTLVDSLDDIADSMNSVLLNYNYPIHDPIAYKTFIGNGIQNLVRVALPISNRDEQTIAECYRMMIETYNYNCVNKTRLYDGTIDLLDELKSRGLKLSVLSNKADEFTQKIVQALMPNYFDTVMGLRSDTLKKPDPRGALQICESFGIPPERWMYVGDTGVDMQTAKNAGLCGVGVLWGFRTREELLECGARYILEHPLDLIKVM